MPDWLKQHIPIVVMFTVGLYVSLQTLEEKFSYQETRSEERYRIQVEIQRSTQAHTLQLVELNSEVGGLARRVEALEGYIPSNITTLEKDVISVKKDIAMLSYQMTEE